MGLIIPAMVVLPLWFFFIGPQIRQDRLEEHGVHVPGRLLDVSETGTLVNDSPELKLVIEFKRLDGRMDTASTDFVPSLRTLHMFQPGVEVTAAYDSTDPHEITVISISNSPPGVTVISGGQAPQAPGASAAVQDSLRRALDSLRGLMQKMQEEAKHPAK